MNNKIILIILVVLSFLSCSNKCLEVMDDARSQKRDTALCYLWRYPYCTSDKDSGYVNFKTNGNLEFGRDLKSLKQGSKSAWYTKDGSYTEVGCYDNGTAAISSYKYTIKGDSLTIFETTGAHPRFIKVSKPIP